MKVIGIVGAGPAGLYAAKRLANKGYKIVVWEKNAHIGGRTKMGNVGRRQVVGGAGVVRSKDKRLRKLAGDLLQPFRSTFHIGFQHEKTHGLRDWIRVLNRDINKMDRSKDFETNFRDIYGQENLNDFKQWVGYTDYLKADVIDTIKDYSFEDCLPKQKMFMINWDKLAVKLKPSSNFRLFLNSPIQTVEPDAQRGGFRIKSRGHPVVYVDKLLWTAPRPSWGVLDSLFKGTEKHGFWKKIKQQVKCQPFLRLYSSPVNKEGEELAKKLYPKHTLLSYKNPLAKVIPYGNNLYMISYSDNNNAESVFSHRKNQEWLKQKSGGVLWKKTKAYYFPCGTHYFSPLDPSFHSRKEFLKKAQNPIPNLFIAGEGLSRNQGWTEGAIESIDKIIKKVV